VHDQFLSILLPNVVALFVCGCVCQYDNVRLRTSKHRTMKLGGRCVVQQPRPSSNLGVIAPLGAHSTKMWRSATTLGKSARFTFQTRSAVQSAIADLLVHVGSCWFLVSSLHSLFVLCCATCHCCSELYLWRLSRFNKSYLPTYLLTYFSLGIFLQRANQSIALQAPSVVCYGKSVRPSLCLSVCPSHYRERTGMRSSPSGSPVSVLLLAF